MDDIWQKHVSIYPLLKNDKSNIKVNGKGQGQGHPKVNKEQKSVKNGPNLDKNVFCNVCNYPISMVIGIDVCPYKPY